MFPGILLMVVGLTVFMYGVFQTKKNPGIERSHLIIILAGIAGLIVGAILAYGDFIESMN